MMKLVNRLIGFSNKIQGISIIRAIRDGLVNLIPVLIIGAFALILKTFPVDAYQDFITTFANGLIAEFFDLINKATFGVLSVYMTLSISRSYMRIKNYREVPQVGALFASLVSFFIMCGSFVIPKSAFEAATVEDGVRTAFDAVLNGLGPKSMVIAIICGLGASELYIVFCRLFSKNRRRLFSLGADRDFNSMLSTVFPVLIVVACFAITNFFVVKVFNVDSFRAFYTRILNNMFSAGETGFFKGFAFVFLSSLLWFFGIHGSDALDGVMDAYFKTGVDINFAAVEAGGTPTVILTKEFFDCFVLMGGCGAAICLLIAILIFSKNRARRGLGVTAATPMIFNINELMVFGLPIIFNPIMLIPFLLVPLVSYSIAYLALATGMVPLITHQVEWTTPIILGGYRATGSFAGAFLQVFLVLVGVAIYAPFVKLLDKESERTVKSNYNEFMQYFIKNEKDLQNVRIRELNSIYGSFAKELTADIKHDLFHNIRMYYQPQYNNDGKCVGVEALLRWKHPVLGILYAPMVMKLASDCGISYKLEEAIFRKVLSEREQILAKFGPDIHVSINATGPMITSGGLLNLLRELDKEETFKGKNIVIELTEQEAFSIGDDTRRILNGIKELDIRLAIDDFSMGQTTLHYLRENIFSIIKIDGSLVKELTTSANCREIVSSLIELADSLSLDVIAEYVETNEERTILHDMGCDIYQGFLYSPAIPLQEPDKE